jgi:surface protein
MIKPRNRRELEEIIGNTIDREGPGVDLNWIDTSLITDMSQLFENSEFNGDISKWDVSNVADMSKMFYKSKFNGDLSEWNVSNVVNMVKMFFMSNFNGSISEWNISNVTEMRGMFYGSKFTHNIYKWVLQRPDIISKLSIVSIRNIGQLKYYGRWIDYD